MSNAANRIEDKINQLEEKVDRMAEALEALMPTEDETSDEERIDRIVDLLQQLTTGQSQMQTALDAIDGRLGKRG